MRIEWYAVVRLIVFALLGISGLFLQADELSDNLKTDRIRQFDRQADEINRGFQQVCAKYHLRYMGPTKFKATFAKAFPATNDICPMYLVGSTTALDMGKVGFTFQDEDGEITEFYNYFSEDTTEYRAMYATIQPPKWTKSYATEVGEAFEAALPIPKDAQLSPPRVEFRQDMQDGDKHGLGHWWFTWWRTDSHGNPLYDHISFCMSEGFCPSSGAVLLSTPFHETKSDLLKEADALVRTKMSGAKPTHYYLAGVIPFSGPFAGKEIRLAWQFWFDPPAPPADPWYLQIWYGLLGHTWLSSIFGPPPVMVPRAYPYSIWIDAYTGEMIGGDSMM